MIVGLPVFVAILVAAVWLVSSYNGLVTAQQRVARAWANIDAPLRRRHDELPRLIEICRERRTAGNAALERVLEARGQIDAAREASDPVALGRAESALRLELGKVLTLADRSPELGSHEAFTTQRDRIAALQTEIAERGALFNDAVRDNNAAVGRFPANLVAGVGGFRSWRLLEIEPAARRGVASDALLDA